MTKEEELKASEWGDVPFENLKGKTLNHIKVDGTDEILFSCADGAVYQMFHYQNCCETVSIEDICGDVSLMTGMPILQAEESTNTTDEREGQEYKDESFTWTFYRMATNRGSLVIRWYGSSNGYYSEAVNFRRIQ